MADDLSFRYTVPQTQRPPAGGGIGDLGLPGKGFRTPDKVCLYFLSVQVGIAAIYDAILHQQGGAPGDKRTSHGSPCPHGVPPAGGAGHDIHAGGDEIRFGIDAISVAASRKGSEASGISVIGAYGYRFGCCGGDRQRHIGIRDKKTGVVVNAAPAWEPETDRSLGDLPRRYDKFPDTAGHWLPILYG